MYEIKGEPVSTRNGYARIHSILTRTTRSRVSNRASSSPSPSCSPFPLNVYPPFRRFFFFFFFFFLPYNTFTLKRYRPSLECLLYFSKIIGQLLKTCREKSNKASMAYVATKRISIYFECNHDQSWTLIQVESVKNLE